ncbi:MAG: hypothetical protein ACE5Q6_26450 [Dehalococcoidia bacterium]
MNRLAVRQRNYPEIHAKLRNEAPESDSPIALILGLNRVIENLLNPFRSEVGPSWKDEIIEVPGGFHSYHPSDSTTSLDRRDESQDRLRLRQLGCDVLSAPAGGVFRRT